MRAQLLWRKVHYWLAAVVALPLLLVILSGLLLQVKKDVPWVQPREQRGRPGVPQVSFEQILAAARQHPQAGIMAWDDVDRVDLRPGKSLVKLTSRSGWEVQLDPTDGRVLQVARRRSDLIEALHDGSWFGDVAKRWVFLPAGLGLAILWCTGGYLFLLTQTRRMRSRRKAAQQVDDNAHLASVQRRVAKE